MQACFRRLYSTIPEAAAAARVASTPRAVRLRRLRRRTTAQSDAPPTGATPTEAARYKRSLAKGEVAGEDGRYLTEEEWLERLNERRTRIRGARETTNSGKKELVVVGKKIYLPNIIFRLVRNHTPSGQPYNPYEATFRIPQSITKTDVRSYLQAVYGVKTTYIRTDNYFAPIRPHAGGSHKIATYKRAVVGLVEPFYYPQALEDMEAKERKEREDWMEKTFRIQESEDRRKMFWLRYTRSSSKDWKWRTGSTAQRGNILRLIAERRAMREEAVAEVKAEMRAQRKTAA